MAKVNGIGIIAIAGGGLLFYSAIFGKSFSSEIRTLLAGRDPSQAQSANPITGQPIPATNTAGKGFGIPGTGTITPSGPGETSWIKALLMSIGAPTTQANINSISAWISHEGPYGTQGPNNPLNTTESGYGGYDWYGSVKGYPTTSNGIAATVATLFGGQYGDIVSALRSGNGLCGQSFSGLSTWSNGGYSQVC